MFGSAVKFVRAGDRPTLIQCGRCHLLGHNKSSPRGDFAAPRLANPITTETGGEQGPSALTLPAPPPPGNRNARRRLPAKAKQTQAQAEAEVGPRAASPSSSSPPQQLALPRLRRQQRPQSCLHWPGPDLPLAWSPPPLTPPAWGVRYGQGSQRAREIQAQVAAAAQVQLTPAPAASSASLELAAAKETLRQLEEDDKRGSVMVPSNFGGFNHLWLVHANPAWLKQREVDRAHAQELVDRASWGAEPREGGWGETDMEAVNAIARSDPTFLATYQPTPPTG
ncbi:hypothetical protein EDB85DRAFT_2144543 [Lactarius pseudohatsudake]|nr:hypothetical protein EDB85DRAFT_2144543 [Lactarius pseudohatsudake]